MSHDAEPLTLHQHRVEALRRALPGPTQVLHTHISTLLLSGDFAYKLRKPLTLAFLDFATPEQRRADCEAELRLNRRTAPDLYLDVLPVYGPEEHAHLAADGETSDAQASNVTVVDWVLRMRALRQRPAAGPPGLDRRTHRRAHRCPRQHGRRVPQRPAAVTARLWRSP